MKRAILLVATAAATIMLLTIPHIYMSVERSGTGQVLWNQNEAFIFLERGHGGYRETPFQWLKKEALAALGVWPEYTHFRGYVSVFHIHHGTIDAHEVPHLKIAPVFPYEGQLYFMYYEGHPSNKSVQYRWTGATFTPISLEEADRIRSSFQYTKDLLRKYGWREEFVSQNSNSQKIEFEVDRKQYVLEVQSRWPRSVVTLRGPGLEKTLATYERETRIVNEQEYRAMFPEP